MKIKYIIGLLMLFTSCSQINQRVYYSENEYCVNTYSTGIGYVSKGEFDVETCTYKAEQVDSIRLAHKKEFAVYLKNR